MIAYLDACMEEASDDPALIAVALGNVARAYEMARLAKETGLTREGLYKALLEQQLLRLPPAERARLTLRVWESLESDPQAAADPVLDPEKLSIATTLRSAATAARVA